MLGWCIICCVSTVAEGNGSFKFGVRVPTDKSVFVTVGRCRIKSNGCTLCNLNSCCAVHTACYAYCAHWCIIILFILTRRINGNNSRRCPVTCVLWSNNIIHRRISVRCTYAVIFAVVSKFECNRTCCIAVRIGQICNPTAEWRIVIWFKSHCYRSWTALNIHINRKILSVNLCHRQCTCIFTWEENFLNLSPCAVAVIWRILISVGCECLWIGINSSLQSGCPFCNKAVLRIWCYGWFAAVESNCCVRIICIIWTELNKIVTARILWKLFILAFAILVNPDCTIVFGSPTRTERWIARCFIVKSQFSGLGTLSDKLEVVNCNSLSGILCISAVIL